MNFRITYMTTTLLATLSLAGACVEEETPATATGGSDATSSPDTTTSDTTTSDTTSPDTTAPDTDPTASCEGATAVPASGLSLTGADFYADARDDFAFDEPRCAQVQLSAPTHVERVFAVDLAAGQTLGACQRGVAPTVLYVVAGCDAEPIACIAAADVDTPCLTYTAAVDETVYVVAEAYFATTDARAYQIDIGFDPTCGDGAREPGEECDDGDGDDDDGCDSVCAVETGWICHAEAAGDDRVVSACFEEGCGDGVLVAFGSGNEECDDRNLMTGDGCNAACDVEVGWSCGAFAGGGGGAEPACWPEPTYELGPSSDDVVVTERGLLLTRFHEGFITFTEPTRFSGEVTGVDKDTGLPFPMHFELVPEAGGVILINEKEPAAWDAVVPAGAWRFSIRAADVATLSTYTYRFELAAPAP